MRACIPATILLLVLPAMLCAQTHPKPATKMTPKKLTAAEIEKSAIIIDTHADTPQRFLDEHFDLGDPLNGGNLNLDSIHKGNLGAEFFSIWVEPSIYKGPVRAAHAGADRRGEAAGGQTLRPDHVRDHARRHRAGAPRAQVCRADGHRGRPLDRGLACAAAAVLRAGRALHDADLVELKRLGRQLRRHRRHDRSAHQGGAERVRQGRGLRDEPAGHDGGYFARLGPDVLSHAGHQRARRSLLRTPTRGRCAMRRAI